MLKNDDYEWLFRKAPVMTTSIAEDGSYLDVLPTVSMSHSWVTRITCPSDARCS